MEARYTTNKHQLPESLLNEMGEAFKRMEPYLDVERVDEDPVEKSAKWSQRRSLNSTLKLFTRLPKSSQR